ncbi:hypothetical protein PCYB_073360 [Plasmodium cynomolgi strain B]|uniref:Protein kinase domain-containing protein n=1 Tax=Plasmodium cynomolgi (strain B) TaxID=1120755 RepID=K6URQ9_PLACD|nr:hypothetical protein PCYB_073360 [Plasmodium cynomolgi strain B]GAB65834.1 hypothetical protein PCYB_073360 [Plasmodium cynomolgi strain B]
MQRIRKEDYLRKCKNRDDFVYTHVRDILSHQPFDEILEYQNGDVYIGTTKNRKRHGYGYYIYKEIGSVYQGEWIENAKSGYGTLYNPQGIVYSGDTISRLVRKQIFDHLFGVDISFVQFFSKGGGNGERKGSPGGGFLSYVNYESRMNFLKGLISKGEKGGIGEEGQPDGSVGSTDDSVWNSLSKGETNQRSGCNFFPFHEDMDPWGNLSSREAAKGSTRHHTSNEGRCPLSVDPSVGGANCLYNANDFFKSTPHLPKLTHFLYKSDSENASEFFPDVTPSSASSPERHFKVKKKITAPIRSVFHSNTGTKEKRITTHMRQGKGRRLKLYKLLVGGCSKVGCGRAKGEEGAVSNDPSESTAECRGAQYWSGDSTHYHIFVILHLFGLHKYIAAFKYNHIKGVHFFTLNRKILRMLGVDKNEHIYFLLNFVNAFSSLHNTYLEMLVPWGNITGDALVTFSSIPKSELVVLNRLGRRGAGKASYLCYYANAPVRLKMFSGKESQVGRSPIEASGDERDVVPRDDSSAVRDGVPHDDSTAVRDVVPHGDSSAVRDDVPHDDSTAVRDVVPHDDSTAVRDVVPHDDSTAVRDDQPGASPCDDGTAEGAHFHLDNPLLTAAHKLLFDEQQLNNIGESIMDGWGSIKSNLVNLKSHDMFKRLKGGDLHLRDQVEGNKQNEKREKEDAEDKPATLMERIQRRTEFMKEHFVLSNLRHPNVIKYIGNVISRKKKKFGLVFEFLSGIAEEGKNQNSHADGVSTTQGRSKHFRGSYNHVEGEKMSLPLPYITSMNEVKNMNAMMIMTSPLLLFQAKKFDKRNIRCDDPYAAPELLREEECTEKCDIYSFGVVMYEILFGGFPFMSDYMPSFFWTSTCFHEKFIYIDVKKLHRKFPNRKVFHLVVSNVLLVMRQCLNPEPTCRPDSAYLCRYFGRLVDRLG